MHNLRIIAASLVVTLSGCSFIGVTPPPRIIPRGQKPECTTSRNLPVIDALVATITGFGAVGAAVGALQPPPQQQPCASNQFCLDLDLRGLAAAFAVVDGLIAAGYAASSAYGFAETNACDEANADYERAATLVPPNIGAENNMCRPGMIAGEPGTCDAGLQCLDNVCVTRCQPVPNQNDAWSCDSAKYDRCDERHVCVAGRG